MSLCLEVCALTLGVPSDAEMGLTAQGAAQAEASQELSPLCEHVTRGWKSQAVLVLCPVLGRDVLSQALSMAASRCRDAGSLPGRDACQAGEEGGHRGARQAAGARPGVEHLARRHAGAGARWGGHPASPGPSCSGWPLRMQGLMLWV